MRVYLLAFTAGFAIFWPGVVLVSGGLIMYGSHVSETSLNWPFWVGAGLFGIGFVYIACKASGLTAFGAAGGPIDGGGSGGGSD